MACYELTYQQRVHRVCVKLRLDGMPAEEIDILTDHVLYEDESVLAAWERFALGRPANPQTPKG